VHRRTLIRAGTAALVGATAGCTADDRQPAGRVRIATGSTTAVYHAYGTAFSELIRTRLPDVQPTVLVTAASAENVSLVLDGGAEVGFTQSDVAGGAFGEDNRLAALARLYDDYVHLVVRADSQFDEIGKLAGRRVSIGAPGSGTSVTAGRVLLVAGNPPLLSEPLGLDDSVAALREQRIEAFFFSGGLPVGAIKRLSENIRLRLIPLGMYAAALRKQFGDYYAERVVPGSTYGTLPVTSIGIANYLVVRLDMPRELAYALTKLLFDGRDALAQAHPAGARLNIRSAISTAPLPLHPGATRLYRERKE
jgi:TRAP transporter TAXI family solute receptor